MIQLEGIVLNVIGIILQQNVIGKSHDLDFPIITPDIRQSKMLMLSTNIDQK